MKKYALYFCLLITLSLLMAVSESNAQKVILHDTGYFQRYPDQLVLRAFLLQKYAPFKISAPVDENDLKYKSNSKLSLGIGATYHSLTLNLSYGFGFLNSDNDKKGETKGLDFQFHLYPHKWAIDALGTFLKGYHLDPEDHAPLNLKSFYYRGDVKRNLFGLSAYRVPNASKFSYRAAMTQNDWQTRSAGSLLFGGDAYFGSMKGDSALVPNQANNGFPQAGIDKVNFFSIGPGLGYAYTLVIEKYFFITGSLVGNLHANFSSEDGVNGKDKKTTLTPGAIYKGAIGYNSSTWSLSANAIGNALFAGSASSSKEYFLHTGNYRLTIAKKIGTKN